LRSVRRYRKPVRRAWGRKFLHMFISAGRPLAVDEKIFQISYRTAWPGAPKEDALLASFGPSAPPGDTIVNYITFLLPAYDGANLGLFGIFQQLSTKIPPKNVRPAQNFSVWRVVGQVSLNAMHDTLGVCVEGLGSQALQNGLKITRFACNVHCCISC